jgi:hypothetical protein
MKTARLIMIAASLFMSVHISFSFEFRIPICFEIDTLKGYICLQAKVNENQESEWFIFDTGSSVSLLYQESAKRLGVEYDKEKWTSFSEHSVIRGGYRIPEITLRINERLTIKLKGTAFVLSADESPLIVAVGGKLVEVAGIIGMDAFGAFFLKISYSTREIIVSDTQFVLNEWQEVTAQSKDRLPFIRLKIGNKEWTALLDSGWDGGLVVPFSVYKQYVPDISEIDSQGEKEFFDVAKLFPPVKIGQNPLSYELISITTRERPYLIIGSLEMIFYDWIIDREKRVYLRRRREAPKIHVNVPSPVFTNVNIFFDENLGILADTIPRSRAARAGLTDKCVVLSVNGIRVPPQDIPPSESLAEVLSILLANPFTETARLRVRCGEQEREVAFQLLPSDRIIAVLMHYLPLGFNFASGSGDKEDDFEVELQVCEWLSYYRVDDHPIEPSSYEGRDSLKYSLVQILGLPEDFTIEDFWNHLYAYFSRGEPVVLVCLDEAGREVRLEVPPRQRMHDKPCSGNGKDAPQSRREKRDE